MRLAKSNLPAGWLGLPLYVTAISLFIAVSISSCQKENNPSLSTVSDEEATTVSQENAAAEAEYDDITEIGFSADADVDVSVGTQLNARVEGPGLNFFENLFSKIGPCTVITVSPNDTTYPKTVTIDYGDGCVCRDGKFRKGAIVLYYTKPLRRPGAELTIKLRDFFVNRAHIEGIKIIKNLTEGNTRQYSVVVIDGKVTWPNGRGFTYEKTKMVTQVRGMDTKIIRDDVYSIVGRSKTVYANGITVVLNTETPLIKPVACNWIVSGVLKIKINNRTLFLDYGNGDCDDKATLKWNDHEIDIMLP